MFTLLTFATALIASMFLFSIASTIRALKAEESAVRKRQERARVL